MRRILTLGRVATVSAAALLVACGDDSGGDASSSDDDLPVVVVTTNVLGDLVGQVVGDLATVEVIMPLGADPHDFAPSTRQAMASWRA